MQREPFRRYVDEINKAHLRGDDTEPTHRPALKAFIEALDKRITATNEPKRIACGAPDLRISRHKRKLDQTIGYIETKDIGSSLGRAARSEQLRDRYLPSLGNLILTDYVEFWWYVAGELRLKAKIAEEGQGGKFIISQEGVARTEELLGLFLSQEPERIGAARSLAVRMAGLARLLRDITNQLFQQEKKSGPLHAEYEAFREVLLHDLTEAQFADMYAQTICYGLFTARCHIEDMTLYGKDKHAPFHGFDVKGGELTREHAAYMLPKTNPFLRKTFAHIAGPDLDDRIAWLVDDIVALLRQADMGQVLREFARAKGRKDPVVHFYETFLSKYDPKLRKARGVYYTPDEVVSYIVRSVDWLLKEKFGLRWGLADESKIQVDGKQTHEVLILDPAVGTGTFLFEAINQISKRFKDQKGMWSAYVREHLLPRLFGFELQMAPYAVCHMKLGLELADSGYDFQTDERLGIYLTNTLEEAEKASRTLFAQWLSEEARAANGVKKNLPIMVVFGNPPYSKESANKGDWIRALVRDYYRVDNQPLNERNPKWLQDDYVKFIRFSQWRIEQTGAGVLGFITNHGYLDNPTFRGMRQQLMDVFSEIYVLDLHGNVRKKEVAPDGSKDENVFDIEQGVAIGLFLKRPGHSGRARVRHMERWGSRESKYTWLEENTVDNEGWVDVNPTAPYFRFVPSDSELWDEYKEFPLVTDVFPQSTSTVTTARNDFSMAFDAQTLLARIDDLQRTDITDDELRKRYSLKDVSYWNLADARANLRQIQHTEVFLRPYCYRPFDHRFVFYHRAVCERLRSDVMCHMAHENIALLTHRPQSPGDFTYAYCTRMIGDQCVAANKTGGGGNSFQFPLYIYPVQDKQADMDYANWKRGKNGRVPNLSREFVDAMMTHIGFAFVSDGRGDLETTVGPEDVLAYVYAILHSPQYRSRYAEYLRIDFPRIPLARNRGTFQQLCRVGAELLRLHLMESELLEDSDRWPVFPEEGNGVVDSGYPTYVAHAANPEQGRVYINMNQYFAGVTPEVWDFSVAGYQVCEKWLKDRRGRVLTFADINHYQKIVAALGETIRLMRLPLMAAILD